MSKGASAPPRRQFLILLRRDRHALRRVLVLLIFSFTGAAGLIYQVAWTRLLISLFGASGPAIATVLTAFMVGLALGSLYFGRVIDRRKNTLIIYAWLEIVIALYAIGLPWLISATNGLYTFSYRDLQTLPLLLNTVRFFHAFALLLVPTVLMGGTLPVLVAFFAPKLQATGRQLAFLYAINTLGAAAGCAVTGFILIEAMGVRGVTWTTAGVQLLFAMLLLYAGRRAEQAASTEGQTTEGVAEVVVRSMTQPGGQRQLRDMISPEVVALVAIGYSGFASLALETLWSRLLAFFLGNTVYGFTVALTTVLLGIASGSLLVRHLLQRVPDPLRLLGFLQLIIGFSTLSLLPVQWQLNRIRDAIAIWMGEVGWWQLTLAKFLMAMVALLIPTLAMGASFPCAVQAITHAGAGRGRITGNVYAVNSFCGAIGSLAAGFVLVHLLGVQRSIVMLASASIGVGVLLLTMYARSLRQRLWENGSALGVALVLLAIIQVDRPLIAIAGLAQGFAPPYRLIDYREGSDATVAVVEDALGVRELNINGISTAFTSSWDMRIHKLLAYLPLVLHPQPERVLIVGYGMGVTARAALYYPTIKQVDVAEILPEVIEMSDHFAGVNGGVLGDPRLHLILNDGKNHLVATSERYDIISTNAIHPGVTAGNGALYTVDFYTAARLHLNAGGWVCQWLPIHQLSTDDVRTLVRSFQVVFPHTSLWFTSDFALLIGGQAPLELPLDKLAQRLADPKVASDLAALDDLAIRNTTDLLGFFLMDKDAVARYANGAALNTDDHPLIEFSAPRSAHLSAETNLANLQQLYEFGNPDAAPITGADQEFIAAWERRRTANTEVFLGQIDAYAGRAEVAYQRYMQALAVDPEHVDARYLAKQQAIRIGIEDDSRGDPASALASFQRALELAPTDAEIWYRMAGAAEKLKLPAALTYLEQAVTLRPANARWHLALAGFYQRRNQSELALAQAQRAIAADPAYGEAYVLLSMLHRQRGEFELAESALKEALRLERALGD